VENVDDGKLHNPRGTARIRHAAPSWRTRSGRLAARTRGQVSRARALVAERLPKAQAAVGTFGDISFDSVLDLLNAARSIKDEFIPQLTALLTPEQKERLAKLPGKTQMWIDLGAAWMAEARVKKLTERVKLTDSQAAEIRQLLVTQFAEATAVMEGLIREDGTSPDKRAVLDAVLDLRGAVRSAQRHVDKLLTPEQRKALEAYKIESEKASQAKADPR
jgi:hypothetical protein